MKKLFSILLAALLLLTLAACQKAPAAEPADSFWDAARMNCTSMCCRTNARP